MYIKHVNNRFNWFIRIQFTNIRDAGHVEGAEVVIVWNRAALEVTSGKG